jgi:D-3-phosphoglycerate dehydrogenase
MVKKKILLLEGIHPGAKKYLETEGFHIETETGSLTDTALIQRAQGFHGIGIRSKTQLHKDILKALPELEVVGAFCIGTDQIALESANSLGIPVFNAPYSNTRSVAELVIAEMIALSRRLGDQIRQMHRGVWQKSAAGANEVRAKTLGIVGYGHIGSQLSVLSESMGLNVLYFDIVKKLPLGNAKVCESLHELLAKSDFVSLHVPDTTMTKNMIGEKELQTMKQGAYLINASRGGVVDIPALAQALKNHHLAGAAIDVYPEEPLKNSEGFKTELQELDNVILTPHIGGSTEEAQAAIGIEVAESFARFFKAGATLGAVQFPQVDVQPPRTHARIINVHKNVSGVLGSINSIISQNGGNIVGQHLATDPNIGYLVADIEIGNIQNVAQQIAELKTSLRTRLINI